MAFRIEPDQVMAGRRLVLVEILQAQPGLCFRALVRTSGLSAGTTAHHLGVLQRHELAWSIRHGPRRRFFAGRRPTDDVAVGMAREAGLDAAMTHVLAYVREHPMSAQLDIVAAFRSTPPSTVQHVLVRLEREQFLTRTFVGRYVRYRPTASPRPGLASALANEPGAVHAWTRTHGVPA
jgi:predicted transcriptional regulator